MTDGLFIADYFELIGHDVESLVYIHKNLLHLFISTSTFKDIESVVIYMLGNRHVRIIE
jgi:hypothetical protein